MTKTKEKLRKLVKRTIQNAELDSYMPYTIDMLLDNILEPRDLVEFGYSDYLKEYMIEFEGNISDELLSDIESALKGKDGNKIFQTPSIEAAL